MQIPSYNGSNDWLSSRQKSNGDGRAHKNPNGSISDSSRTPQRPLGVQRPVPLRTVRAPPTSHSADSWREKVMGLFDPALQDAEDLMLSLPYTAIRMRTDQLANALDEMGSLGLDESSNRQHPILRTPIKARSCPARLTIHSTSERSRIKKAIYACYESLITIIVSYNQSLGHETEMQARRALTASLAEMDKFVT